MGVNRASLSTVVSHLKAGRVGVATGYVTNALLGTNLYHSILQLRSETGYLQVDVHGHRMYLDRDDRGLSRELLDFREREQRATERFRSELDALAEQESSPVVLELGGNRGYYAFQAAEILGPEATVVAVEPEPRNVDALVRGVRTNGYVDRIAVYQCAVGGENTVSNLRLSLKSNGHTINDRMPETHESQYRDQEIGVPVVRTDDLLDRVGLTPADVDVVRTDAEGFECEIFDGAEALLESDSSMVLFLELHPHRVATADHQDLLDRFVDSGFEILAAWDTNDETIATMDALRRHVGATDPSHTVELFLRR